MSPDAEEGVNQAQRRCANTLIACAPSPCYSQKHDRTCVAVTSYTHNACVARIGVKVTEAQVLSRQRAAVAKEAQLLSRQRAVVNSRGLKSVERTKAKRVAEGIGGGARVTRRVRRPTARFIDDDPTLKQAIAARCLWQMAWASTAYSQYTAPSLLHTRIHDHAHTHAYA